MGEVVLRDFLRKYAPALDPSRGIRAQLMQWESIRPLSVRWLFTHGFPPPFTIPDIGMELSIPLDRLNPNPADTGFRAMVLGTIDSAVRGALSNIPLADVAVRSAPFDGYEHLGVFLFGETPAEQQAGIANLDLLGGTNDQFAISFTEQTLKKIVDAAATDGDTIMDGVTLKRHDVSAAPG
ncbi:MAG TPA: hypothetical protein VH352_08030, partial [Pseudonocardiaceae bacterium]|nr:hypothetical protein [Pseudonocardiaceae bacterium]